jgi:hypothetical protein
MVPISQAFTVSCQLPVLATTKSRIVLSTSEEKGIDQSRLPIVQREKHDMAIDVLEFASMSFEYLDSFIFLAKLYLQKGDRTRTKFRSKSCADPSNEMRNVTSSTKCISV